MTNHLKDKVIVVTGAGSGFGQLVCEKTSAQGAQVVLADVNSQAITDITANISQADGEALAVTTDVTDLTQMQDLISRAKDQFGRVDVLVNNAGIMPLAFYADHKEAHAAWDRCIDINIKGVLNGITAVYDLMIEQSRGHVVNLSSIYSNFPVAGAAVYGATKAAVNFLSEALRVESQGRIKVTNVRPTGVPATGLASAVMNPQAIVGILGQNAATYGQQMAAFAENSLPAENLDAQHIEYFALAPEHLAEQIVYAINQPWGVSIGDITVRASGDGYIL